LANANCAQTVLYFFLLMLYKTFTCKNILTMCCYSLKTIFFGFFFINLTVCAQLAFAKSPSTEWSWFCIELVILFLYLLCSWIIAIFKECLTLHSDTLFWFRANQSLLFPLNAAFLADKQQIPILYSFVWQDRGSYPSTQCRVVRSLQDRIAFIINIYQHSKFIQSVISIPPHNVRILYLSPQRNCQIV
jgi:hypothetical protein